MATAPWRCSQCGTINEPVANSCRTCGKWPSLFDLEDSVVDEDAAFDAPEPEAYVEPGATQTVDAPEPVTVEVETFEPPAPDGLPAEPAPKRGRFDPPPTDPVGDGGSNTPRWVSWLIPLAVVAYFVISTILNNR